MRTRLVRQDSLHGIVHGIVVDEIGDFQLGGVDWDALVSTGFIEFFQRCSATFPDGLKRRKRSAGDRWARNAPFPVRLSPPDAVHGS